MPNRVDFDIDQLIKDTVKRMSFPDVVVSLMQTLKEDCTDVNNIEQLIEQKPALAATLIHFCNSAIGIKEKHSANPTRHIEPARSVRDAIELLGTEQITTLSVALCANEATRALNNEVIELDDYWHHCLLTACLSSTIASDHKTISITTAFIGGLLHDIGQLPLFYRYPTECNRVLALTQLHPDKTIVDAETQIFGFSHEEVGGKLAQSWNLPPRLTSCLSTHHSGVWATDIDLLSMVVHIANILSTPLETRENPTGYLEKIHPTALAVVISDIKRLPDLLSAASRCFDDMQSSILV